MIVRDESKFLPGCLASVRGVADEIVVVDTGSKDDTVAIASAHGCRVVHVPWRDDFASARNESLRRCSGRWVLMLDADERLAPGQEVALRGCCGDGSASAYMLQVRSRSTLPTGIAVHVMPYARLFRNDARFRFEGTIHEQITPSIERAGGKIVSSSILIEHLGYGQGVGIMEEKAGRNLRLLHERLGKNPHDAYACYHIGSTASMFQRYGEAKEYLRRALRPGGLPDSIRAIVWDLLGEAELRTGAPAEAEKCCRSSLALAPVQLAARWYIVGAHIARKDFASAVPLLREILSMFFEAPSRPPLDIAVDLEMDESIVRQIMGQCMWKMGDGASALEYFAHALRLDPSSPEIRSNFDTALAVAGSHVASSGSR
jgi:Flp pilus assembly protein TadD